MMTRNIKWGPPIERDESWGDTDTKPDWLDDDTPCMIYCFGAWCGTSFAVPTTVDIWKWDSAITKIKLPEGHPAYLAIEKGFIPWGGGDSPPADWDGRDRLLRSGEALRHCTFWRWRHSGRLSEIIGYRRAAQTGETPQ